ncbi:MAG: hypothetical protein EBQ96_09485 [Proteobacteria bacterium]|nr:hypothetical protein [Pseudomonadota bacterium]
MKRLRIENIRVSNRTLGTAVGLTAAFTAAVCSYMFGSAEPLVKYVYTTIACVGVMITSVSSCLKAKTALVIPVPRLR